MNHKLAYVTAMIISYSTPGGIPERVFTMPCVYFLCLFALKALDRIVK